MSPAEALAILDHAADNAKAFDLEEVRKALRALHKHRVNKDALVYFWEAANSAEPIGRSQSMNAARNRIRLFVEGKLKE
jgi:hypothetical protein